MKKKAFEKREMLFSVGCLAVINILCIVKFIISLVNHNNFLSLMEQSNLNLSSQYKLIVIMSLVMVIFAIISFIVSFVHLVIRNSNVNKNIFIVLLTVSVLSIIFFFILRFLIKDLYSMDLYRWFSTGEGTDELMMYDFKQSLIINLLYVLASFVLTIINSILCINLSKEFYKKNEDSNDNAQQEQITDEETAIKNEIQKLKTQIRIKDLETEYLNLKAQLDERSTKNKN